MRRTVTRIIVFVLTVMVAKLVFDPDLITTVVIGFVMVYILEPLMMGSYNDVPNS